MVPADVRFASQTAWQLELRADRIHRNRVQAEAVPGSEKCWVPVLVRLSETTARPDQRQGNAE